MARSMHFDIKVQGTPRFSIRAVAARKVGLNSGMPAHLIVTQGKKLLFKGWHDVKSGLEIYGTAITKSIKPRTPIHVVIHT